MFGGLRWQTPIDGLSVALEHSSDDYSVEARSGVDPAKDPWSIGVNWKPNPNLNLGIATINGKGLAFNMTAVLDPRGPDLWPKSRWTPPAAQKGSVSAFSRSGVTPLALGQAEDNCTATISAAGVRSAAVAVERSGQALAVEGCATAQVLVAREGMVLSETRLDLSGAEPVVVSSAAAAPGMGGATALQQPAGGVT